MQIAAKLGIQPSMLKNWCAIQNGGQPRRRAGQAVLPLSETVRHWMTSPRSAVDFLVTAATMDLSSLGHRRNLNMPGASVTVAEQIEALRQIAGNDAVRLIRREPDNAVMRVVNSWPRAFDTRRAHDAGFRAESSFHEILKAYIDDDLGGGPPR